MLSKARFHVSFNLKETIKETGVKIDKTSVSLYN